MKTLKEFLKSTIINLCIFSTTLLAFYASAMFFMILLLEETYFNRPNPVLKDDFEVLIQKLHNAPEILRDILYPNQDNKDVKIAKEGF
ncbi:MAG: hypothetical protein J7604_08175 [Sporocytophaga sp.]|uniref:hypothetical protein n=1 Tax=Sporocytophaga sp. TaxID=2231183 RepID=UPI001B247823|nr:hypothetical protein [Sporocytophaga sp.]MBO9700175.1 hypothetical protein [Sporocytophaga sp.]